ncbi:MAG: ABC transporter substrate-binding protein [Oscillospiraceae bacterium]|jgi:peptide/nickel transport system substrate-binding protein|nr:ABC transporter substrate-binding protein [Oscillospiraceae bacterium]
MIKRRNRIASLLALVLTAAVLAAAPGLAESAAGNTPLVYATETLSQKFSPFFADTAYDNDVVNMTAVSLLTTDRVGGIVYGAIDGETRSYNGTDYEYKGIADITVVQDEASNTTAYTAKIKPGVLFSDGKELTADDVIFTYYVYLDPAYVGSTTLNSYPIVGLKSYLSQTPDTLYDKYSALFDEIYAAGRDHEWSESDGWTKDQQDAFWTVLTDVWTGDVQAIVDYVVANYANDYAEDRLGVTPDALNESDGLKVALGMVMWGFAKKGDDGLLTSAVQSKTWTLEGEDVPTIADYFEETYAAYGGDAAEYWNVEQADGSDVLETARTLYIGEQAKLDTEAPEGGVANISGIKKLDQYTVEVTTNGYEAPAIYSIFGVNISPLHYYGDPALYDYDNNQFGHPFGDLSLVESKTSAPMGAGPFKFIKYENRIAYFEANDLYYEGSPATRDLQFKETASGEVAPGVKTGTVDVGEMTGSKANFQLISGYNSNGEATGDVITTVSVDNLGYGYIGLNADTVSVGGEPFSDASKYLRKAIATVISVYRDVAINSYYGDAASIINYPISSTSWAAPQPTDEGYKVAFSVGVDGADLYTSDMAADQKYAAAIEAAKQYLIAAGFTFDEASGKFTEAPEGAKLEYEIIIAGDGVGDHPSFAILTDASGALASIGFTLRINDPSDSNEMWDRLDAGTQELWCAAWQSTIDPDMYQIYHSSNIVGKGGSDSNHYHIALPELDQLIIDARQSDDQAYRKAIYKQALDLLVDEAVEIPVYQRQIPRLFSTERIDIENIIQDITTYIEWSSIIPTIGLNANK